MADTQLAEAVQTFKALQQGMQQVPAHTGRPRQPEVLSADPDVYITQSYN
jgi:hypothetical protein